MKGGKHYLTGSKTPIKHLIGSSDGGCVQKIKDLFTSTLNESKIQKISCFGMLSIMVICMVVDVLSDVCELYGCF